jgi:hypothetical protein
MKLKGLRLKRVSLCETPANQESFVVLYKAATKPNPFAKDDGDGDVMCSMCKGMTRKGAKYCAECGGVMKADLMDKITDPETKAAVAKMVADLAAAQSLLDEKAAKEKAAPAAKTEDDVLKSLPAEARSLIEKANRNAEAAQASAKLANDALLKMETERVEKEYVEKAQTFRNISVDAKVFGPILKRVHFGQTTAEDEAEIVRVLTAANKAAKPLMTVVGKSGSTSSSARTASDQITEIAKGIVEKSGGKTPMASAMDTAVQENPELWNQHLAEMRSRPAAAAGDEE